MLINEITSQDDDRPVIKLRAGSTNTAKSSKFVKDLYERFPKNPMDPNQIAMVYGDGDDQRLALVELVVDKTAKDTVEIKWISTYPQRQGVGRKALSDLQALAKTAGVKLVLTAWKHGTVPERVLNRFYKSMGFKQGKSRSGLQWDPDIAEASWSAYDPETYDDSDRIHGSTIQKGLKTKKKQWYDRSEISKKRSIDRTVDMSVIPVPGEIDTNKTKSGKFKSMTPPIVKPIPNMGELVLSGHSLDRMVEREVPKSAVLNLLARKFRDKFSQMLDIDFNVKFVLKDRNSGLGIVMVKGPMTLDNGKKGIRFTLVTVHPEFDEFIMDNPHVIDEVDSNLLNKPTPSIEDLALKYDVSPHDVLRELAKGVEIEKEHTNLLHIAREIALDHLSEDLYYYVKLAKAETMPTSGGNNG